MLRCKAHPYEVLSIILLARLVDSGQTVSATLGRSKSELIAENALFMKTSRHVSGLLCFDAFDHVVEIVLNQHSHRAHWLIRPLREWLTPLQFVISLGGT